MAVAHLDGFDVSRPKKKTAGERIKEFYDKHDGYRYQAGEILEVAFRDLEKIILEIRAKNKDVSEYFIVTHSQKVPWLGGAMHIRTFWRHSRPDPAFNFDCYRVTNPGDRFELEWCVPSEAICRAIAANPSSYDVKLAEFCCKFLKGELK